MKWYDTSKVTCEKNPSFFFSSSLNFLYAMKSLFDTPFLESVSIALL